MTRIALPALTVLIVVATFVGLAGWNRSGEPRLSITLTERELRLPWQQADAPGDDPGLQLQLEVHHRSDPLDARNWLPETRLRALGFPLNVPLGDPAAAEAYDNLPARVAWIALEYDGPAWQDIERRAALTRQGGGQDVGPASEQWRAVSRLVPVDASLDFDALRAKYPTGHLIVRAVIAISYVETTNRGALVYGWVREIVPATVAVPRNLRPVLDDLMPVEENPRASTDGPSTAEPRYEADLAIGRLGLPYIRAIRRLDK